MGVRTTQCLTCSCRIIGGILVINSFSPDAWQSFFPPVSSTEGNGSPIADLADWELPHSQRNQEVPQVKGVLCRVGAQIILSLHRQLYFYASGVSDILCLRAKVLPPLRDVTNRPEVGNTLRNKLVRLMTHIDTDLKDCAAEFLFILCKENGEELCLSSFQISSKTK